MNLAPSYIHSVENLTSRWRQENVSLNPGATVAEFDAFEQHFNLKLPAEFRYLYSIANGMSGLDMDSHLFSLWPLQRIMEEKGVERVLEGSYLAWAIRFADFLINSHQYMMVLDKEGHNRVLLEWDQTVSATFSSFIEKLLTSPQELHLM